MTKDQILAILTQAAGNPTNGAVKDILPELADALAHAMHPVDTRVIGPAETR
jgi:diacylglycerol kinase family enzyme